MQNPTIQLLKYVVVVIMHVPNPSSLSVIRLLGFLVEIEVPII